MDFNNFIIAFLCLDIVYFWPICDRCSDYNTDYYILQLNVAHHTAFTYTFIMLARGLHI